MRRGQSCDIEKKKLKRKESKLKSKVAKHSKPPATTQPKQAKKEAKKKAPVITKEGKMVFSKFDFCESKKKEEKTVPKTKKFKKLIDQMQKKKEKLETVEENEGKDAAKKLETNQAWKDALRKAEGVKVVESEEYVKTRVKKMEKKKEKSRKKWGERKSQVEDRMNKKQEKRKSNIKAKKDQRKEKKVKRLKKKGRMMPGF